MVSILLWVLIRTLKVLCGGASGSNNVYIESSIAKKMMDDPELSRVIEERLAKLPEEGEAIEKDLRDNYGLIQLAGGMQIEKSGRISYWGVAYNPNAEKNNQMIRAERESKQKEQQDQIVVKREERKKQAEKIVDKCVDNKLEGCVAAHTITNLFYILRKIFTVEERREVLLNFCEIFEVVDIDNDKLIHSLRNNKFNDFEDGLQLECAKVANVDYIVTRNLKDFESSNISVIDSEKFIQILE